MSTPSTSPSRKRVFFKHGLHLVLDPEQVVSADPGQGTPAMVFINMNQPNEDCGTYSCALGTRELSHNGTQLNDKQIAWLDSMHDMVEHFLEQCVSDSSK